MLVNGLSEVQQLQREESASGGLSSIANLFRQENLLEVIARSPQLAPHVAEPDFMEMVQCIRKDPTTVTQYLSDPRIQTLVQVLLIQKNPEIFRKAEEEEIRRQKEKVCLRCS